MLLFLVFPPLYLQLFLLSFFPFSFLYWQILSSTYNPVSSLFSSFIHVFSSTHLSVKPIRSNLALYSQNSWSCLFQLHSKISFLLPYFSSLFVPFTSSFSCPLAFCLFRFHLFFCLLAIHFSCRLVYQLFHSSTTIFPLSLVSICFCILAVSVIILRTFISWSVRSFSMNTYLVSSYFLACFSSSLFFIYLPKYLI